MKYVHRPLGEMAEINSGGNTRAQFREIGILTGLAALTLISLYFAIGLIVDAVVIRLSPEKEASLFAFYRKPFTEAAPPTELAEKWEKAHNLLHDLTAASVLADETFTLGYLAMEEPNAFALPGGAIVLTKGLLEGISSDGGLAFVLAHELGHFAHRDHLRGLGRQLGFKLAIALLFGSDGGFSGRASDLALLKYSRHQEAAADEFALELIERHFGKRDGVGELFELLQDKEPLPSWAYMFTTHPDNLERLRKIAAETKH